MVVIKYSDNFFTKRTIVILATDFLIEVSVLAYRKVASTCPSRFEAHVNLFRLLMQGIFDGYVL